MSKSIKWLLAIAMCISCYFLVLGFTTDSENPLKGAWKMKSIQWISPDTTFTIAEAQPGLLMMTDSIYSFMWTRTQAPRTPFKVLANPTDEEIKAGFQSVVYNAGTYKIEDNILKNTAFLARVPGFEGGEQIFKWTIDNNILTLVFYDETYPNGGKPDWLGTWQTKFVLEKF